MGSTVINGRKDVESLAGFQEGFHAGKHARPAPGNFAAIFEPALNCVRHREAHQVFNASISNVTRDLSARSSGSAQVSTRRLGGLHSKTLPVIQTCFLPFVTCSHFEPFFQSETFAKPAQY